MEDEMKLYFLVVLNASIKTPTTVFPFKASGDVITPNKFIFMSLYWIGD